MEVPTSMRADSDDRTGSIYAQVSRQAELNSDVPFYLVSVAKAFSGKCDAVHIRIGSEHDLRDLEHL